MTRREAATMMAKAKKPWAEKMGEKDDFRTISPPEKCEECTLPDCCFNLSYGCPLDRKDRKAAFNPRNIPTELDLKVLRMLKDGYCDEHICRTLGLSMDEFKKETKRLDRIGMR